MEQKTRAFVENTLGNDALLELFREIGQGKPPALLSLYDATNRLLFGITLKILSDRAAAEETLLDIYTQIWNQSIVYDDSMPALEWLISAAHYIAIAQLHWAKREPATREPLPAMNDASTTVAPEQQQAARSAMQSMEILQKELLEKAYYGGLSCAGLAAQIGKPVGAVKAHIRSGLGKIEENYRQTPGISAEAGTRSGGAQ